MSSENEKIAFDELDQHQKEALTPRGEYLKPEALDQGTSVYDGAPSGPVDFEAGERPQPVPPDEDGKPQPSPKRKARKGS